MTRSWRVRRTDGRAFFDGTRGQPANVMICPQAGGPGRVKVLDFGLAAEVAGSAEDRLTQTGHIIGTLQYMSPEHCRAQGIGPASDVYSFGVMLYEILTGALPFDGRTPADLMAQHLHVAPPPLERGAVPPAVAAVVMWALGKKPEQRPSAAELRTALRQAAARTDAVSQRGNDATQRIAVAGLSRAERGLTFGAGDATSSVRGAVDDAAAATPRPGPGPGPGQIAVPAPAPGATPVVVLWGLAADSGSELRDALAVHGTEALPWRTSELPLAIIKERPVGAVVLPGDSRVEARLRALRSVERFRRVPVLVVQVPRVEDIPALVRAGASDVALASTDALGLTGKALRLVRRGR